MSRLVARQLFLEVVPGHRIISKCAHVRYLASCVLALASTDAKPGAQILFNFTDIHHEPAHFSYVMRPRPFD